MYVLTNDGKLVDLNTGNVITVDKKNIVLQTYNESIPIGKYEKPEDELKNLASKLTTYVMPQGVEKK